jgi:hypothetical protein
MGAIPKRRIEELVSRYKLEPTLRDVFVEGEYDWGVLSWYLKKRAGRPIVVYPIDTIDVPSEIVKKYAQPIGERGEVIALASELHAVLTSQEQKCPTCIADRDNDRILGKTYTANQILLFTDFACMEMQTWDEEVIKKLLHFSQNKVWTATQLMDQMKRVLQLLFIARLANQTLRMDMAWVPFEGMCHVKGTVIEFEQSIFVRAYLSKSAQMAMRVAFENEIAKHKSRCDPDCRFQINGHDYVGLLTLCLRETAQGKLKTAINVKAVEHQLVMAIEMNQWDEVPLMKAVLCRINE